VDGKASLPFDLDPAAYQQLGVDSLSFFYPQRSGIPIADAIAPGYGREAGHTAGTPNGGDTKVPCVSGGCDYTLDVTGGWYDAGDHGKYVVNGGISVWQGLNQWERVEQAGKLADGTLVLPESGH